MAWFALMFSEEVGNAVAVRPISWLCLAVVRHLSEERSSGSRKTNESIVAALNSIGTVKEEVSALWRKGNYSALSSDGRKETIRSMMEIWERIGEEQMHMLHV